MRTVLHVIVTAIIFIVVVLIAPLSQALPSNWFLAGILAIIYFGISVRPKNIQPSSVMALMALCLSYMSWSDTRIVERLEKQPRLTVEVLKHQDNGRFFVFKERDGDKVSLRINLKLKNEGTLPATAISYEEITAQTFKYPKKDFKPKRLEIVHTKFLSDIRAKGERSDNLFLECDTKVATELRRSKLALLLEISLSYKTGVLELAPYRTRIRYLLSNNSSWAIIESFH